MRICLIGPTHPFRGGIAHYTTLLYRCLAKRHTVRFFSFTRQYPQWLFPGSSDRDPSKQPLREAGVRYTIDSLNPLSWFRTVRAIRRFAPDLLIIPWWSTFWTLPFYTMASLARKGTKPGVIFLCHNVQEHESHPISDLCSRRVLSTGDGCIVHSGEEARRLRQLLPAIRVYQGFHPTYAALQVVTLTRTEARRRLGVGGNVILFFGFIRPYKGLDYLLEAIPAALKKLNGDLTVMVVGECWQDERRYAEQIQALGIGKQILRVNRYVSNEEMALYFAAADVVAVPYLSATGSGILQAALGAGRPVIASRVGALAEAVEHGRTGYLVPPADAPHLARALISFFEGRKGALFESEIARRKELFSWDRMAGLIEQIGKDYA